MLVCVVASVPVGMVALPKLFVFIFVCFVCFVDFCSFVHFVIFCVFLFLFLEGEDVLQ